MVSNKDCVGGKFVFEIIGVWTCLLETLEYFNVNRSAELFLFPYLNFEIRCPLNRGFTVLPMTNFSSQETFFCKIPSMPIKWKNVVKGWINQFQVNAGKIKEHGMPSAFKSEEVKYSETPI